MKPIRLSKHALGYATKRGFTMAEVEEAIRTGPWGAAELGRLGCRKDYPFGQEWNGQAYAAKQVRPVFVEEADRDKTPPGPVLAPEVVAKTSAKYVEAYERLTGHKP